MSEKSKFLSETLVSVILIALLLLLWKPGDSEMTNQKLMMLIVALIVIFGVFASFVFREGARDERESLHRLIAGRFAYLIGAGILLLGIILQSLAHTLDYWLVWALTAMILAKLVAIIYSKLKY